jgi:hypothetical protein
MAIPDTFDRYGHKERNFFKFFIIGENQPGNEKRATFDHHPDIAADVGIQ